MIEYGPLIQKWRLKRRLTQAELAKEAGIPQPNLSNIEKGKQDITVSTLERISIALGVKPSQLMDWEDARALRKKVVLTRRALESLARAVVAPNPGLNFPERRLVELFKQVVWLPAKRVESFKKAVNAWTELKACLTHQEIKTIHERILDALARKKVDL
jgi:transcriptional regulator with XRE-family HTH domain